MTFEEAMAARPSLCSLVRQLDANLALVAAGNPTAHCMVAITLDQLAARGVRMG
jgi:hypothetical protein